jgi:antitoxin (DNA-binding transcriptional repressor) of toxin-antitoxin stability system
VKRINIHEAKTHLSRYAQRVKAGETLILCDRNVPFAEIRPLAATPRGKKRSFGLYKGRIRLADDFDAHDQELERVFEESPLFPKR